MAEDTGHSQSDEKPPRTLVIGVGNLLLKDEGIGVHLVRALQEAELADDITLIDAGTAPDLIAYANAGDKLVIIDAAKGGGEPGTVYRLRPGDLTTPTGIAISAHELGVEQGLALLKLMGNEPGEIIIIGIEPQEIDFGTELSAQLQNRFPHILNTVLKEIRNVPQD